MRREERGQRRREREGGAEREEQKRRGEGRIEERDRGEKKREREWGWEKEMLCIWEAFKCLSWAKSICLPITHISDLGTCLCDVRE